VSLEIRIEGAATLHRVAAQMRAEGRKDLGRAMGTALSRAADPVKVSIRAEADEVMPSRGGYKAVFSKSLKFRLERRNGQQSATVQLITYASGKAERRDIGALNRGNLRHPVFGRGRRLGNGSRSANPWAVTSIRAGFHKRGTDHAMAEAQKQLSQVIHDYAQRLIK
jgi:hypothetical protein